MYTYRSSCPLVSETPTPPQVLWPNESENAFFSKDSKQRQRSSKIPTWFSQQIEQKFAHPTHLTAILGWDIGYRISDLELSNLSKASGLQICFCNVFIGDKAQNIEIESLRLLTLIQGQNCCTGCSVFNSNEVRIPCYDSPASTLVKYGYPTK